ncbi:MAG TPA: diadenylate cyclase [Candidatus Paceibacterota bacterium]|nr:diadenylate cyclase [Candidatus Paceibacterota bacterium]
MLTIFLEILDILTTAFIIYTALVLLKKTRSIYILRGFFGLGLFYIAAVFLNLKLTTSLFQAFISFFIIILVILFQKEIRRFFENFTIDFFVSAFAEEASVSDNVIEIICNVVAELSKTRRGALIVLPGKQSLERVLEGGTPLNGKISEPLLLSIFDPKTPGHDGAVTIEGDIVKRFMVHLPLADMNKKYPGIGTRHRAGLGLAERTDAMIIIVSEERGSITIARNNDLHIVANAEKLKEEIHKFKGDGKAVKKHNKFLSFLLSDTRDKLFILAISTFLWYLIVHK